MSAPSTPHLTGIILVLACVCIFPTPAGAQKEGITYRLTIQIHEAPGFNSFHLFYIANFQLPDGDGSSREVDILVPSGDDIPKGFSAYPLDNTTRVSLEVEEGGVETRLRVTTNGSEFEVRYFIPTQARTLKNDDLQVIFPSPRVETSLRGMTVAINWPNWKYQVHKITPEGAEMVMNPMFETDPYKSVSYYWYFSSSEANAVRMDEISVTLRTGSTISRVNRNQTIIILLAVICIPTVIFIAINPPKKMKSTERQRKFRITDERDIRAKRRRERYKVK